jgi:hypothetical protein
LRLEQREQRRRPVGAVLEVTPARRAEEPVERGGEAGLVGEPVHEAQGQEDQGVALGLLSQVTG